jgi:hypothetical protein
MEAMRSVIEFLHPSKDLDWWNDLDGYDAVWESLQWLVPEVIALKKCGWFFGDPAAYVHFITVVTAFEAVLAAAAIALEGDLVLRESMLDKKRCADYQHNNKHYRYSLAEYRRPWDHWLLGAARSNGNPVPWDPTGTASHLFLSGAVRLTLLWEFYCHRGRVAASRVN